MRNKIAVFDCCRQGDKIWFSNLSFNSLMQMDLNTAKITVIGKFPDYGIEERNLHRRVFLYGNRLYFIPRYGKTIDIYDISENNFKTIKMPEINTPIADAVKIKKEIWMFPASTEDSVYVFHIDDRTVTPHTWLFDQINKSAEDTNMLLSVSSVTYRDNLIWIGIYNKNLLYRIDVKKRMIQEIQLSPDFHIESVDAKGDKLWLTDAQYPRLNLLKNGKLYEYYAETTLQQDSFSRVIENEKYRMVLPHCAAYILFSDINEKQTDKIPLPDGAYRCRMGTLLFAAEFMENICMFIPFSLDCVLRFDMKEKIWSKKDYHIQNLSDEEIQETLKRNIEQQKYTGEMGEGIGWEDTLPVFIEKVPKQPGTRTKKDYTNVGDSIFKNITGT